MTRIGPTHIDATAYPVFVPGDRRGMVQRAIDDLPPEGGTVHVHGHINTEPLVCRTPLHLCGNCDHYTAEAVTARVLASFDTPPVVVDGPSIDTYPEENR